MNTGSYVGSYNSFAYNRKLVYYHSCMKTNNSRVLWNGKDISGMSSAYRMPDTSGFNSFIMFDDA